METSLSVVSPPKSADSKLSHILYILKDAVSLEVPHAYQAVCVSQMGFGLFRTLILVVLLLSAQVIHQVVVVMLGFPLDLMLSLEQHSP